MNSALHFTLKENMKQTNIFWASKLCWDPNWNYAISIHFGSLGGSKTQVVLWRCKRQWWRLSSVLLVKEKVTVKVPQIIKKTWFLIQKLTFSQTPTAKNILQVENYFITCFQKKQSKGEKKIHTKRATASKKGDAVIRNLIHAFKPPSSGARDKSAAFSQSDSSW